MTSRPSAGAANAVAPSDAFFVWHAYSKYADIEDSQLVDSLKDNMDGLLIFAGLYSASLTALLMESYRQLFADSSDRTVELLEQLLAVAQGVAVEPPQPFVPSASSIRVNIVWFASLVLSFHCAVGATMVKQWVTAYDHETTRETHPVRRATMRMYLGAGLDAWKVKALADALPILLHGSLVLFFIGLVDFLFNIHQGVALVVSVFIGCGAIVYMLITPLPFIYSDCQLRTPFSSACSVILRLCVAGLARVLPARPSHDKGIPQGYAGLRLWSRSRQHRQVFECGLQAETDYDLVNRRKHIHRTAQGFLRTLSFTAGTEQASFIANRLARMLSDTPMPVRGYLAWELLQPTHARTNTLQQVIGTRLEHAVGVTTVKEIISGLSCPVHLRNEQTPVPTAEMIDWLSQTVLTVERYKQSDHISQFAFWIGLARFALDWLVYLQRGKRLSMLADQPVSPIGTGRDESGSYHWKLLSEMIEFASRSHPPPTESSDTCCRAISEVFLSIFALFRPSWKEHPDASKAIRSSSATDIQHMRTILLCILAPPEQGKVSFVPMFVSPLILPYNAEQKFPWIGANVPCILQRETCTADIVTALRGYSTRNPQDVASRLALARAEAMLAVPSQKLLTPDPVKVEYSSEVAHQPAA